MNTDQAWRAVLSRDTSQDGKFWYGVSTTGVYCRPSCAARRPNPENVRYFASPGAATRSGLRACNRCKPDSAVPRPNLSVLLDLCRHVESHADQRHNLASLSARSGLSQFQVHRLFKSLLQLTPREYIEQVRLRALKQGLRAARSVTDGIYEAGFEASSSVYGRMDAHLGMTPKDYRAGGAGVGIHFAFGHTTIGVVLIGATGKGLCYVQFGESEHQLLEQLRDEYPKAQIEPSKSAGSPQFERWMQALNERIAGGPGRSCLPLEVDGTAFQKRVWDFLQTVPRGEVLSYSEVAHSIDLPRAVRAVANACASNRIGVFIPCHRVVRGDGELGGYRWGVGRKRALIDAERGQTRALKRNNRTLK